MKKEIIIVTISLGNDGAERILTELARQWVHDGHHITVIQTSPNRYGNEYALEEGIEQIEIHTTSSNKVIRFMQEIKELIKILKTRPNATCLSFLSASSFILAISSWFVNNRIVFSERNNPCKVPIGWHQQALRNFAFRFAALISQNLSKSVVLLFQILLMVNCHHQLRESEKRRLLLPVDYILKKIYL